MAKKSSFNLKQYRGRAGEICHADESECGTRANISKTDRPHTREQILDDAIATGKQLKKEEKCAGQGKMLTSDCLPSATELQFNDYRLHRSRFTVTTFGAILALGVWLAFAAMPSGLTRYEVGDPSNYSDFVSSQPPPPDSHDPHIPDAGNNDTSPDPDDGAGQGNTGNNNNNSSGGESWPPLSHDGTTKFIAFTFDDGPNPSITPRLLDLLERHNIPATFFVIGNLVTRYTQIVARMIQEGHVVGNHSWSHANMARMSSGSIINDIARTNNAIQAATGAPPTLMRPPFGATSATLQRTATMPLILWSIDTRDWQNRNANTIYNIVIREAKSGSIVLFHDIYHETLVAVERLIPVLKNAGFVFVTVPEMLGSPLENGKIYYGRL